MDAREIKSRLLAGQQRFVIYEDQLHFFPRRHFNCYYCSSPVSSLNSRVCVGGGEGVSCEIMCVIYTRTIANVFL